MTWRAFTTHRPAMAIALAMLLVGVIVGISFVAQPAKFSASGITLAQQVRIGSVIFHASHMVQLGLLGALMLAVWGEAWTAALRPFVVVLLVLGLLGLQALWLMPALDARVADLSSGIVLRPAPWLHVTYAALELGKPLALIWLTWCAWRASLR